MTPSPTPTLHPRQLIDRLGIKPGARVGDFGVGGSAHFVGPLAAAVGSNGEVLMFDILKSALSSALSTAKLQGWTNCKAVWCNLEVFEGARGIGQNSLDAGVLVQLLSQTAKHREVLAEVHRMLKPGAQLLIVDWEPAAVTDSAPQPKDRLAADHALALARSIGFAPAEKFSPSPSTWGLVVVKT